MTMRKQSTCVAVAVALTIGVTTLVASVGSAQTTFRVPSQYPTIQAAVNATNRYNDVVLVAPGVYRENVTLASNSIRIVSEEGPDRTVIDGGGVGTTVRLWASMLVGFTVTNGVSTGEGGGVNGGHVERCILTGNRALRGGGFGGGFVAKNCIVYNNTATTEGGGIFIAGGRLDGCLIMGNTAGTLGGGAFARRPATLNGNTIVNNRSNGNGGGISVGGGGLTNTILWGNSAALLGQQAYASQTTLTISYCLIDGGANGVAADPMAQVLLLPPILTADPLFAGPGDYHITAQSPAFQAGDTAAYPIIGADVDGNPRIALGRVDIGADEFAPHLYKVGSGAPGTTLTIRAIAPPGAEVFWALSGTPSLNPTPPLIPGFGLFRLFGPLGFVALGRTAPTGVASFSIKVPAGLTTKYPSQALVGYQLSEPLWVP